MNGKIDFTDCRRVFEKAYNGANGKKIAVEYGGRQYMLKFPPSGQSKPTELSYYRRDTIYQRSTESVLQKIYRSKGFLDPYPCP